MCSAECRTYIWTVFLFLKVNSLSAVIGVGIRHKEGHEEERGGLGWGGGAHLEILASRLICYEHFKS